MSALSFITLIWSQAVMPGVPKSLQTTIRWLLFFGEPTMTSPGLFGAVLFWLKVLSLMSLLGWIVSWVSASLKERTGTRASLLDFAALAGLALGVVALVVQVLQATSTPPKIYKLGGIPAVTLLGGISGAILLIWTEVALWKTIRKLGNAADLLVLFGVHAGLALGLGLGVGLQQASLSQPLEPGTAHSPWQEGVIFGARFSATYMGFVVLFRIICAVLVEVINVRWRRLYSIARLTITEANRRMWAPWVVLTVFLVVLAFTHWFLVPPRAAEMGRLYVGTLSLLCSLLLTVMITILTPLSLPTDIQQQTIYTVVSKPVRRIELIWGRMLGYMAMVTVLIVLFGGISLAYLWRTIYTGAIVATEQQAQKEADLKHDRQARHLRDEANQLRSRMSAREPIHGSLSFLDSRGNFHVRGIDVGQDQSMREPRSHIEGGTPATATWRFGIVRDPWYPNQQVLLDRRIPVDRLLVAGTIEGVLNRVLELRVQIAEAERKQAGGKLTPTEASRLSATIARNREELKGAEADYAKLESDEKALRTKAADSSKAGKKEEAEGLLRQAEAMHTPRIPLEMTFNIYRTTKGRIGEPVYAEIVVTNPNSGEKPYQNTFAIREYYTNQHSIPARLLAGSMGGLKVEIRCLSPTQYLGMAESDLYILARAGNFGTNYMKGLFGVWLQAMVLTAIGVFAGTFLSWPVALLTTIAFFIAGQVAFAFLLQFTLQSLQGGGPFESLIRLLTHDNQMSDLAPTLAVVTAKTFDSIVMPVMSRLVYVVPNFSALDVSNTVADGFEVQWGLLGSNFLLALAYALPFSIAGYFILKNREVAA
ncbi:hypothetical protein [Singulisphaera sp. PoT]|uniref:hypothetical protein n=1 Tax=Singulisphaera sp. PoT TaxID=3411797 RepID=UPI003BF4A76A